MGLCGSAGFTGGTSGGGSGRPRPITISSMFKMSESIIEHCVVWAELGSESDEAKYYFTCTVVMLG